MIALFGPSTLCFLLSFAILLPQLAFVAFARALRNYSRRRLEERYEAKGRPEIAIQVAHLDEKTALAAEAMSIMLGFCFVVLFGEGLAQADFSPGLEWFFILTSALIAISFIVARLIGGIFAEAILEALWPVSGILRSLASPLSFLIRQLERLITHLAGFDETSSRPASVEVEVEMESESDGESEDMEAELPESARKVLEHAVELTRTEVAEIMTPRTEIVSMPSTVSAKEAAKFFRETGLSRIPVYGENRDDVVGILYAKDLFARLTLVGSPSEVVPASLVRPPFFVPESKNAFELLEEFRAKRTQIALILDEYGGVAGLITLEDLLEELVGFIDDEHDVPTPQNMIVPVSGSRYEVDASLLIETLNDRLHLRLPTDEDYQTLGGLALHTLGKVPERGETFRSGEVTFTVTEVSEHSVRRMIVDLGPVASTAVG